MTVLPDDTALLPELRPYDWRHLHIMGAGPVGYLVRRSTRDPLRAAPPAVEVVALVAGAHRHGEVTELVHELGQHAPTGVRYSYRPVYADGCALAD